MNKCPRGLCFAIAVVLAVTKVHAQAANEVVKQDPALDNIVPANAQVEKLAGDLGFVEGPVWVRKGGYLLFSDIPANVIDKWSPGDKISVFLKPSGFTGTDASEVGAEGNNGRTRITLIGSNGITLDRQGRVV